MAKSYCYRNLRQGGYSVAERGLVIDHVERCLLDDVELRVRQGGRARVLTEGVKNVHAFVIGTRGPWRPVALDAVPVMYDPRKVESFVRRDTGEPVVRARRVWLRKDGAWALLEEGT